LVGFGGAVSPEPRNDARKNPQGSGEERINPRSEKTHTNPRETAGKLKKPKTKKKPYRLASLIKGPLSQYRRVLRRRGKRFLGASSLGRRRRRKGIPA